MQIRFYKTAVSAAALLFLTNCASQDVTDYAGKTPDITVKNFYSAPIEGYGFFQERSGKVKDRYYATLIPTWTGNEGIMVEKQWNDKGELFFQQTWNIHLSEDGHRFTATASRIDGQAQGDSQGFAMHMTYAIRIPTEKGGESVLDAQDWTYLQPDGHGINKVALSKYGVHIGDITYDLHKVPVGELTHTGYFSGR